MSEPVPDGDLLIHAGDATIGGTESEVAEFAEWFLAFPHPYKVFLAGNHDWHYFRHPASADTYVENLHERSVVIEGLTIYGSSWQPEFHNWAYGLPRGEKLKKVWSRIPENTDILVTHTPPKYILDKNSYGLNVGCEELYKRVLEVKPKLHVFGHIHEDFGVSNFEGTTFVNASICDRGYKANRKPIVIDLPGGERIG